VLPGHAELAVHLHALGVVGGLVFVFGRVEIGVAPRPEDLLELDPLRLVLEVAERLLLVGQHEGLDLVQPLLVFLVELVGAGGRRRERKDGQGERQRGPERHVASPCQPVGDSIRTIREWRAGS
jgi:hypothetical protein